MTHEKTTRNGQEKGRDRPFPWRCPKCLASEVRPAVVSYSTEVNHDGRLYHVEVPELEVAVCGACGQRLFGNRADEQVSDALRAKLGLLTPVQIRGGIRALGLRQKEVARQLGVAEATLSRWVTGSLIQSRAMDNLMRVYFAFDQVREALGAAQHDPALGTFASAPRPSGP
jgi:putative zinc finger/helix-turn-helix YgiT family protein